MGDIEDARGELVGLGNAVETYVQDTIAAADQERFTSLPERLQRAHELALELGQLLTDVEVDMLAYAEVMRPYSSIRFDNPNGVVTELVDRAKLLTQYGSERMREIPYIIDDKMGLGAVSHIAFDCPKYAKFINSYREQLRKMGDRTEWLAERLKGPWSSEAVAEQMTSGCAEVKRAITNPGL